MTTLLIGQERAEAILARALSQDRLSHAYLFVGPESTGKHTAALLLAQAVNCASRIDTNACGACESCRRIAAGTHPDVRVLLAGSKSGQNISVEQIREVRQDVARRPILGRRKLYLIPNAEAMNEEAANALLKTLEEPPNDVTLILMATSPTRVLPTLLSRCQVVRFGLASAEAIREWLTGDGMAPATAAALAISSGGRPGLARRWSREPEALERRRQVLELLADVIRIRKRARQSPGEATAAFRLAERARALVGPDDAETASAVGDGGTARNNKAGQPARKAVESSDAGSADVQDAPPAGQAAEREEPAPRATAKPGLLRLLESVRGYYRDLLLLAQGAPESLVGNADALPTLVEAAALYTPAELLVALAAVGRCQQFLERNVAPQLAFETLFLALLAPEEETATIDAGAR